MLDRETSQLFTRHQIRLDRRKGQNYLVNDHILARIVESAGITTGDVVLEIGAGIGTLTIPLARKASKVLAIEQDKKIARVLSERLHDLQISNAQILWVILPVLGCPHLNKVVSS